MKLLIIEGIGKKETIERYLGAGYKVFATKGHIRDLPQHTLAVDVKNNFQPKYDIISDKKEIVKSLVDAAKKADEVYLATDPDREGEAISWHVANILGIELSSPVRIVFNEISKKAVQNALSHPRAIDLNLVDAQQARRVLDRLVGYKISPVLCKKIQSKLSAGRVQSVTLRLIVEREREILNFKPEEYWPFFSILENKAHFKIKAALATCMDKKLKLTSKEQVEKVVAELDGKPYTVTDVKKSVTKSKAPAPFTTSTMQQDALNKLGMSLKVTSLAAQELYEGVNIPGEGKIALVTYIRTDSTRVSADAIQEARAYVSSKYGPDFIPAKPNYYASKKSAQDAHEAIRPITLERTPESLEKILSRNNYRLYKLIYERFLASQMSEATYNALNVDITAGAYGFKVTGKTPLFAGYTILYKTFSEEKENEDETNVKLPELSVGENLAFLEYKYEQKFTKPPSRFTEASLVKIMEDKGIGRPATYSPIITLLGVRMYTEKEGKHIKPTELGMKVTDMLTKYFPEIMDVKFTAFMEQRLDEIEEGGKEWQGVVGEYYQGIEEKITQAMGDNFSLKKPAEKTDIICEQCGSNMVKKEGRFGVFLACPNYPKCKNTKPIESLEGSSPADQPSEMPANVPEVLCEKCGKTMVARKGKFGPFLACPGYPKCKNIKNIDGTAIQKEQTIESEPCPECGKPLVLKKGKSMFFGCSGYPECKFSSAFPIVKGSCPQCGGYLVQVKNKNGTFVKCGKKDCDYQLQMPQAGEDKT